MPSSTSLELELTGRWLRHQAGKAVTCRSCGELLDWRRAVSLDLIKGADLIATRIICVDCADAGAIRAARRAGRAKDPDLAIRLIDGRLLDSNQVYHPPEALYRLGIRCRSLTRTRAGAMFVPGVDVVILHPDCAATAGWFAYRDRSPEGVWVWFLVHALSGFASGQARSLRGCIHTALSRMLSMRPERLVKCLGKASRDAARDR